MGCSEDCSIGRSQLEAWNRHGMAHNGFDFCSYCKFLEDLSSSSSDSSIAFLSGRLDIPVHSKKHLLQAAIHNAPFLSWFTHKQHEAVLSDSQLHLLAALNVLPIRLQDLRNFTLRTTIPLNLLRTPSNKVLRIQHTINAIPNRAKELRLLNPFN